MDALDLRILKLLSFNARLSFNEIAKRLKVSPATIAARIRKMEKKGILSGYTIKLDYEKLGFGIEAFIEVTFSRGMLIETEKRIAKLPGVIAVYDITGESDALVHVVVRDKKELSNLIKSILTLTYVERTVTKIVLNKIKENMTDVLSSIR